MYKLIALFVLGLCCTPLWAADCSVAIEGNDAMQYNLATIAVPATCKKFSVTLKHAGTLARNTMGHNWVLTRAADEAGVNADGLKAGLDSDYLKPADARVLAHTRIIGGGESDTATFTVNKLKAGEAYAFFCSYPGHAAVMKGTLTVATK